MATFWGILKELREPALRELSDSLSEHVFRVLSRQDVDKVYRFEKSDRSALLEIDTTLFKELCILE